MTTPAEVIATARLLRGVPFQHQGRSTGGIDCGGVLVWVAHRLRLSEFDTRAYRRLPDGDRLRRLCEEHLVRSRGRPPGAVLLMKMDRPKPQHLAIVTHGFDYPTILHATSAAGAVVEHRLDEYWDQRVVGTYLFPGVVYPAHPAVH